MRGGSALLDKIMLIFKAALAKKKHRNDIFQYRIQPAFSLIQHFMINFASIPKKGAGK